MQKRSFLILLALAAATVPASATAISTGSPTGQWYHILTALNVNAGPGPDGSPVYFSPGAAPWTFTLASAGTLDFADAQNGGDSYDVLNNGLLLTSAAKTSEFDGAVSCGFNPAACFGDARFARLIGFNLAAGTYSLDFVATLSPTQSSSAFFRVNGLSGASVPEPSTYALCASALGLLAHLKRRQR